MEDIEAAAANLLCKSGDGTHANYPGRFTKVAVRSSLTTLPKLRGHL